MNATELFNQKLPQALERNAADARTIGGKFQFNIAGAGNWNVDLTQSGPSCKEGIAAADCVISMSSANFDKFMANPKGNAVSMMLFGKLKVEGNKALAMKLERVLGYK